MRHRRGPLSVTRATPPGAPASDPPRVAYAVGKRVGTAVARNRLRRRLRSAVKANAGRLRPGVAYLVSAGPGASSRTTGRLVEDLEWLLEEAEDERDGTMRDEASG